MARPERVWCELAGPALDAAAHVLAHVPVSAAAPALARASSLFDPRYVAWAREQLPAAATAPVVEDAAMLGALVDRARAGHLLQALLALHDDLDAARCAAARDLELLDAGAVPWALSALRSLAAGGGTELVELARCTLGLVAAPYGTRWERDVAPAIGAAQRRVAAALEEAARDVPSLAAARVALAHPLGRRGRALPDRLVVGAPTAWSGHDAVTAAALAVHEHAVSLAGAILESDVAVGSRLGGDPAWRWSYVEHMALAAVPRRLRRGRVAEAYRRHARSLDRSGLSSPPWEAPGEGGGGERALDALLDHLAAPAAGAHPRRSSPRGQAPSAGDDPRVTGTSARG